MIKNCNNPKKYLTSEIETDFFPLIPTFPVLVGEIVPFQEKLFIYFRFFRQRIFSF